VIWIGSGLAAAFVFALLLVVRSEGDAALHNDKSAISGSPAVASAAKTAKPAPSGAADPNGTRDETIHDWPRKLEQLKTDGNWNMVVLYAGEWARAQPDNASAWKALAGGYVKLRQYRDALDAASKAVQLAPDDAAAWQSLGQVNAALRQPAEALRAFEQAVARDDRDAASMVQIGTLATQLGRYPDARVAFARALALNPADVDAMCGAASVAQKEQRAKDAETLLRQVAAQDARCRDLEAESVRVAIGDKPGPAISAR
jgi:tetratricopeptide (TPR) repeat protein